EEGFTRLHVAPLAHDAGLAQIALGEVDELVLLQTQDPHIAAGCDDDTLHQAQLAVEGDALRRGQRLASLVEHGNRVAPLRGERGIVLSIDGRPEGTALHSAAGEASRDGRQRLAVRVEHGGIALPQRVLRLPANRKIVTDPEVALAIEHRLATRAIAA